MYIVCVIMLENNYVRIKMDFHNWIYVLLSENYFVEENLHIYYVMKIILLTVGVLPLYKVFNL